MQDLEWSYLATIALYILIALSAIAAPAIKRFARFDKRASALRRRIVSGREET